MNGRLRVLVVEDSPVARELLVHVLGADPRLTVVGTAADGEQAVDAVRRLRPDVVTMDLHLPRMNGVQATKRIMETQPTPIVVVSGSVEPVEVATAMAAIEAGALVAVPRPPGPGHPDHRASAESLRRTVRLMAEVKPVRRWPEERRSRAAARAAGPAGALARGARVRAVGIGASTGGPPALRTVLAALGSGLPVPVLVVQHMSPGFIEGLARWLEDATGLPVRVASDGDRLVAGHVYLAPDEREMGVTPEGRVALTSSAARPGLRPSVGHLFRSLRDVYGAGVVGVLLTGMGRDGAAELRELREAGAVTIAQDQASSVVHGMPGEAIRLDGASHVLPLEEIGPAVRRLATATGPGRQG